MSDTRHVKIMVTAAVSVYFPVGRLADRAAPQDVLLKRLHDAGDYWSDGRRPRSVEQLQAAAEEIVRNAIEWLADRSARDDGYDGDGLENHLGLAMARVYVSETPVNEEHTLTFEIAKEPES